MKAAYALALTPFALALVASQVSAQPDVRAEIGDQQRRLIAARAQSAAAAERATRLVAAADAERDEAAKARTQEAALGAKVEEAQADIAAATARVALVDRLLGQQQTSLAAQQGPVARLIAALCSLARRPEAVGVMQPGSVADLVHVRAVLGTTLPAVRARTAGLRSELDRTRRLRADAVLAAQSLAEGRRRLETNRIALARLEAEHRLKSQTLSRSALAESDRALGLGERAREIVDTIEVTTDAVATDRALSKLDGPLPRPPQPGEAAPPALSWSTASAPYRLPVAGTLITGFGEVSAGGVTSRGLTLAVAGNAPVVAPAPGKVIFSSTFRDYGLVVIVDHGGGWTSLISGLGALSVTAGQRIEQGERIGSAPAGENPQIVVELRRRGRPVDLIPLTG